jgi:transposase
MRLGDTDRALARAGLIGRRKAAELRALAAAEGWLLRDSPLPDAATLAERVRRPSARSSTTSAVEPYREEVLRLWGQKIQGTTIHDFLRRRYGFEGSYSSVRRFLQAHAERHPQASMMLDFEPGEAAQVDFGSGPVIEDPELGRVATWVFVMTLAWSRHTYAEVVLDQTVATWLACHRRAFEFFGGVPARLVIDNPKCAITRACYTDPEVQRAYGELAEGYGFRIDPCPPRDPKKKGRVESGVKFIKRRFLPLRDFRSLTDANRQLAAWLLGEAGHRIHGTTHERPLIRFEETERHLLGALPERAPEPAVWTRLKLPTQCHLRFEKAYYSAPFRLIGRHLWLRATPTAVQIYEEHSLVAVHARLARPGQRSTVADHLPPAGRAFLRSDPAWCRTEADTVGAACSELVGRLLDHPILERLRAVQGILRLGERFGTGRLEAACQRALAFDDLRYRTVKTILERGLDAHRGAEVAFDQLAETYTGSGRFCRDTRSLLVH